MAGEEDNAKVRAFAETITASDGDVPAGSSSAPSIEHIGRYQIVKQLGAGGMGIVWEAYDPLLKRGVAIKELHARGGSHAERLRREAQALAQLSHRNVVTVYDVGEDHGELYLVMQLLGGTTLDGALATRPRTLRKLLPLLVQAGRGLAAAHAAGIVHRDFKPANVLVDGDDVRVTDFGLSRVTTDDSDGDGDGDEPRADARATLTRGIVGTPAYMSPEQYLGGKITPATDQFSFCVTLWETLLGERPFPARDPATLREQVVRGELGELPSRVPRRIRRVLVRGLARDPAARYASMTELLDELAPPRRALWIGAGAGVAVIAAAASVLIATRSTVDPCRNIGAQADATWTPGQHSALQAALGALAPRIVATLDDRTAQWRAERLDACQATHVRHDQSADVLDKRYRCLERELAEERAAIALLAMPKPSDDLLSHATSVVEGIDPSQCSRDGVSAERSARYDPRVAALEAQVADADVAMRAGRDADVIALAKSLSPQVIATDDPELAARWFWTLGESLNGHADTAATKDAFRRAAEAATRAGNDAEAVRDWTSLVESAVLTGDLGGVDDLLAVARGAAARSGKPSTEIDLALAESQVAVVRGNVNDAIAACKRASAAAERQHVTGGVLVKVVHCMVGEQMQFGDYAGAVGSARHLLETAEQAFGKDHPETLNSVRILAAALSYDGDLDEARPLWNRVITRDEQLFGADSMAVVRALTDLAATETPYGEKTTPDALAAIDRAAAIADRILPPTDPQRGRIYETRSYVTCVHAHDSACELALERAIATYEKVDNTVALARVVLNLADEHKDHHHCELAVPEYRRAQKLAAETGASADMGAFAQAGAAVCLARAHDWAAANDDFATSIAKLDALDEFVGAARARQNWAELLAADGQKPRAKQIAQQAIDKLAGKPKPAGSIRDELAKWVNGL